MKDKTAKYFSAELVMERLSALTDKAVLVDALTLARRAGTSLTENMVMLGTLSAMEAFPVPEEHLRESVASNVPKKAIEVNLKAFELGKEEASRLLCGLVSCRK